MAAVAINIRIRNAEVATKSFRTRGQTVKNGSDLPLSTTTDEGHKPNSYTILLPNFGPVREACPLRVDCAEECCS